MFSGLPERAGGRLGTKNPQTGVTVGFEPIAEGIPLCLPLKDTHIRSFFKKIEWLALTKEGNLGLAVEIQFCIS